MELRISRLEKQLREKEDVISSQVNLIQDLEEKVKEYENTDYEDDFENWYINIA